MPGGRRAPGGRSTGPSGSAPAGSSAASSSAATASGTPSSTARCTAGGSADLVAGVQLGFGVAHADPTGSATAPWGSRTRRSPPPCRRRRGCAPGPTPPSSAAACPRPRAGPAGPAGPSCPAAARRRTRPRRPVRRPGWRPRQRGSALTVDTTDSPPEVMTRGPGQCPAEFLGGAPGADDHRAHRIRAATHAPQRQLGAGAPPAHRAVGVAVGQRHRARCSAGSGPPCGTGRRPAPARSRGAAPAPAPDARRPGPCARCAAPSTAAARCARPGRAPGRRRCRPERHHPRRVRAHHRAGRDQVVGPPAAHQRVRLGGPGVATDHCGAAQLVRPQHRDLAGVRVRRPRLGQRVVAVVPDDHQAQIGDRREHRAAGADDQPGLPAQHRQPAPVPLRGTQPRRQRDHPRVVHTGRPPPRAAASTSRWSGTTISAPTPGVHRRRGGLGQP